MRLQGSLPRDQAASANMFRAIRSDQQDAAAARQANSQVESGLEERLSGVERRLENSELRVRKGSSETLSVWVVQQMRRRTKLSRPPEAPIRSF